MGCIVQGVAFGGAKIWNSEILHTQLSILFTVHTNAIVVTIRDCGGGGGKHPRAALTTHVRCHTVYHTWWYTDLQVQ